MQDFSSMETRLINSKIQADIDYGQQMMLVTTPDADMKENIDYFIGGLGIAYRRRRMPLHRYKEISIRNTRVSGAKTEKQKILAGECRAQLFIWEFEDCWIICTLEDVTNALQDDVGYSKNNTDGATSAYYIPVSKIPHIHIKRRIK